MSEKTKNWAAFGSEWIKAVDVLSNTDEYVIVSVDSQEETKNGKKVDTIILEIARGDFKKKFGCNATNTQALQEACPECPEDALERIITFNKVRVTKPGTEPPEIVDGLRLVFKPIEVKEPGQVDTDEAGITEQGEM